MSCFIVSNETTADLAASIAEVMNSTLSNVIDTARSIYDRAEDELQEAFNACVVCGYCEPERVARVLRAENLAAYNSRYGHEPDADEIDEGAIPERKSLIYAGQLCELLKKLQCYCYQISEDGTIDGAIYKALREVEKAVALRIAESLPEYKATRWG